MPAGEVAYAAGETILTRHFVWRQARTGLISSATSSVFLVSEVLGKLDKGVAEQVPNDLHTGLQTYFSVTPSSFLVDAGNAVISW